MLTELKFSPDISIVKNQSSVVPKLILLSFLIIWILGFFSPIIFPNNNSLLKYLLNRIYSRVCHQVNSKCIIVDGESMLVCARCTGIYFGVLFAGLFTLFYKFPYLRIKIIVIGLVSMILDVCFSSIGIYSYSKILSLTTGLFIGGIVYLFLIEELEKFYLTKTIKRYE